MSLEPRLRRGLARHAPAGGGQRERDQPGGCTTRDARGGGRELLVYPDEGHGLARLANRVDAYPKAAAFLTDVLRP
ncbi:MAG: hypothetical protein ACR2KP_06840 [Egibacteraceae bacterium]